MEGNLYIEFSKGNNTFQEKVDDSSVISYLCSLTIDAFTGCIALFYTLIVIPMHDQSSNKTMNIIIQFLNCFTYNTQ